MNRTIIREGVVTKIRLLFAFVATLMIAGCSARGMDHILSMKEIDQLENIAAEMPPEEAQIFQQTVIAEVRRLTIQLGMSAMAEGLANYGDPSRDPSMSKTEETIGKLQAMDGKTARVVTTEILEVFKSKLQAEKASASKAITAFPAMASQVDLADFDSRIATLDRKIALISKTK